MEEKVQSTITSLCVLGLGLLTGAPADAADTSAAAGGGLSVSSSSAAADSDASATTGPVDEAATTQGGAYGEQPEPAAPIADDRPYMKRYLPEANTWEIGLGGTALFPSKALALQGGGSGPYLPYHVVAIGAAARIAYFPLTFLGLEGEVMMAESRVAGRGALMNAYRGHVILQLPTASIVPFILGGVGGLGAASQRLGHDLDFTGHFGAGVKIPFSRVVSLRAEFRENMTQRTDNSYGGISFSEEAMLGAVFTLGRKPLQAPPPPPPPADRDRDTVPDASDLCPDVAALTADGCPLDTDGDGVRDPDDYCPREAAQTANGCPDPDPDQDGIKLPCDLCPDEVGVAPDGCPIRDKDGDGIFDDKDQCIDKPETKNGFEDDDGCPDEVPKEVEKFTGTIKGIQFVRGSAQIARSSEAGLMKAADVLKKYPSVRLEISGHTSSEGDPDYNQKLSEDRAASVRDWLVDIGGVDASRLVSRGAGFSEPVADNKTPYGRAQNRRIEFKLLQGGASDADAKAAKEQLPE